MGYYAGRTVNVACCEWALCPKYYDCTFAPCFWSVGLLDCVGGICCIPPGVDCLCIPVTCPIDLCCSVFTKWDRAAGSGKPILFKGDNNEEAGKTGIQPQDVSQGLNGNCWLISSIAAVAERPERIEALFVNQEANMAGGPYRIKLYDASHERWDVITVDDLVPQSCLGSLAISSASDGGELWAILLEKALSQNTLLLVTLIYDEGLCEAHGLLRRHEWRIQQLGVHRHDRGPFCRVSQRWKRLEVHFKSKT